MNQCHPPDHSRCLVPGTVKGICAGERQGGAGGHRFIPCGWVSAVREVALGGSRPCFVSGCAWKFSKEKRGCDLLRQKRSFKNKVKRERFLGLEGCWTSRKTHAQARGRGCQQILSVSRETLHSPLCGQWKNIGLWFLGTDSTREKVFKISVWESTGIRER